MPDRMTYGEKHTHKKRGNEISDGTHFLIMLSFVVSDRQQN